MPKAVKFDHYGGIDVLKVEEVPRPAPGPNQVLVKVEAAGVNPGEAAIREGAFDEMFPATFPSGQGSDLAGTVAELGAGAEGFAVGDAVIGFVETRSSQAEFAVVDAKNLTFKPAGVSWEAAGGLPIAGTTAYAAVRAVGVAAGDTVVVSGAAGGVGSLAVQLAKHNGARVIGLASGANHEWLAGKGVVPVVYGDGVAERIREAAGGPVDACIDTFGSGYIELALDLGVRPERVNTIIDFAGAKKHGVKAEGSADASSAAVLAELAGLVAQGDLQLPVAGVYPLSDVQDAYRELEQRHTRGKIVLKP